MLVGSDGPLCSLLSIFAIRPWVTFLLCWVHWVAVLTSSNLLSGANVQLRHPSTNDHVLKYRRASVPGPLFSWLPHLLSPKPSASHDSVQGPPALLPAGILWASVLNAGSCATPVVKYF